MKHIVLIISLFLLGFCSFAQVKSSVEKDGLYGMIKSVHSYAKDAGGKETFYYKALYNQQGMKTKYIATKSIPIHLSMLR